MFIFKSQKSEACGERRESIRSQKIQAFINGERRDIGQGATVSELLNELDIKPQGIAVELNLEIVSKSKYDETVLKDGDKVEIVRMVGGG